MIAVGPATTKAPRDCSAAASGGAAATPDTTDAGGTPPCAGETMDFGAPPPLRSAAIFEAADCAGPMSTIRTKVLAAGEPLKTTNATATAEPPINAANIAVRNSVRRAFA